MFKSYLITLHIRLIVSQIATIFLIGITNPELYSMQISRTGYIIIWLGCITVYGILASDSGKELHSAIEEDAKSHYLDIVAVGKGGKPKNPLKVFNKYEKYNPAKKLNTIFHIFDLCLVIILVFSIMANTALFSAYVVVIFMFFMTIFMAFNMADIDHDFLKNLVHSMTVEDSRINDAKGEEAEILKSINNDVWSNLAKDLRLLYLPSMSNCNLTYDHIIDKKTDLIEYYQKCISNVDKH